MFNPLARAAITEMKRLVTSGIEPHKLPWSQAVHALSKLDLEISQSLEILSILADRPAISNSVALKRKCLESIAEAPKRETWKFLTVLLESDFREDAALEELSVEILREISENLKFPKTEVAYFIAALHLKVAGERLNIELPDFTEEISRSSDVQTRARCVWGLGRISSMGYDIGLEPDIIRRSLDASELAPASRGCSKLIPQQQLLTLIQLNIGLGLLGLEQSQIFMNVKESIECSFELHNQNVNQIAAALWWLFKTGESNPFPEMYALCVNRTDTMSRSDRSKIQTCLKYTKTTSPLLSYIDKKSILSRKHRSEVNWRRQRT